MRTWTRPLNNPRGTYVAAQLFRISYPGIPPATNSSATQSELRQNTATKTKFDIFSFFIQAGFIPSITFMFFSCMNYSTINYKIYTMRRRKQYCPKEDEHKQKKGVQQSRNKTVRAFPLGKLAQLFYFAHSFAFFLGEIQLTEQQQSLDPRSQYVYGS